MAASPSACRACHRPLGEPVLDLGLQPVIDDPVPAELAAAVPRAPVVLRVCRRCELAQLDSPSTSQAVADPIRSLLAGSRHGHARRRPGALADHLADWCARVLARTGLRPGDLVVDVASGDGALLDPFRAAGMAVLGHEPDPDLALEAAGAEIPTSTDPFGSVPSARRIADAGGARLVVVNHALAHADDLDSMTRGIAGVLGHGGWIAIELLDLAAILDRGTFDVIGHAHRSYLSMTSVGHLLARHGLSVVDARRSTVHGGSLQILARAAGPERLPSPGVARLLDRDARVGVADPAAYARLGTGARDAGSRLRRHLEIAARSGRRVAAYGAPGRAVALLSVADVDAGLLSFTVDRDPAKIGRCLPGSAIPIRHVDALRQARPDEIVILAWTWAREIAGQLAWMERQGARLVVPLPRLRRLRAARPQAA